MSKEERKIIIFQSVRIFRKINFIIPIEFETIKSKLGNIKMDRFAIGFQSGEIDVFEMETRSLNIIKNIITRKSTNLNNIKTQ